MTFIIMEIWDMRWRRVYMQIQFSKYFSFKKTIFVLNTPRIYKYCNNGCGYVNSIYWIAMMESLLRKARIGKNSCSQLTVKKCNEAKSKYKESSYSLDCFLICHLDKESEISFLQNYSKRHALYWLIVVESLSF
jgi:hypothetical protein